MMTAVQPYVDMILKERSWSWAVVCLLYVLAALFVRSWFMGPVTSEIKTLDRKITQSVKSHYLKISMWGWLFFFLPLGLIVTYWQKEYLPFILKDEWLIALGIVSLVFSIILHLQAFAIAASQTLKEREETKLAEV